MLEQRVILEHEADAAVLHREPRRVLAVEENAAAIRIGEAGDRAQQCRLAGAGRSEQRDELSARDRQIDVAQRGIVAEVLLDILDADLDAMRMRRFSDGVDRRFDRRSAIREAS